MALTDLQQRVIAALQDGLPLTEQPYRALAQRAGCSEAAFVDCVQSLQADGLIKRFGVVVRHHELGYRANAMVVWDVPDERVARAGRRLSGQAAVTLCYQRPRRLPQWPYNLFCMIHGRRREQVLAEVERIAGAAGLGDCAREVLFSKRRFKQCGARYVYALESKGTHAWRESHG